MWRVNFFKLLFEIKREKTTIGMGENGARRQLLEAFETSLQQPQRQHQSQELPEELQRVVQGQVSRWNHVRDVFFMGDELRMFNELRIEETLSMIS